jgi:hypothetical protein
MKNQILFFFSFIFIIVYFFNCNIEKKIDTKFLKVPKVTSFTGRNLTDGILSVYGNKDKNILHITNEFEKFYITVPYSEDWIFTENPNSILHLQSDTTQLIASITKENSESLIKPSEFLDELQNRMETRLGIKFENREKLESKSNTILKYDILNTENGYRSFHYWAVRQKRDKEIYKYHISFLAGKYFQPEKITQSIIFLMDDGFKLF